ncbi:MAG: hypothetical protein R2688_03500 [Fimbriimonadaceae bacterium]
MSAEINKGFRGIDRLDSVAVDQARIEELLLSLFELLRFVFQNPRLSLENDLGFLDRRPQTDVALEMQSDSHQRRVHPSCVGESIIAGI